MDMLPEKNQIQKFAGPGLLLAASVALLVISWDEASSPATPDEVESAVSEAKSIQADRCKARFDGGRFNFSKPDWDLLRYPLSKMERGVPMTIGDVEKMTSLAAACRQAEYDEDEDKAVAKLQLAAATESAGRDPEAVKEVGQTGPAAGDHQDLPSPNKLRERPTRDRPERSPGPGLVQGD